MKYLVRMLSVAVLLMGLMLAGTIPAGADTTVPLLAGQYTAVGTVTISDDGTSLFVTYRTSDDWLLGETHLAIAVDPAGIPQTRSSNPKVGQFDPGVLPSSVDAHTIIYEIPLPADAQTVYIAAHAVVTSVNGQEETAWGEGIAFSGSNWAMYIEYAVTGGGTGPVER